MTHNHIDLYDLRYITKAVEALTALDQPAGQDHYLNVVDGRLRIICNAYGYSPGYLELGDGWVFVAEHCAI